MKGLTRSLFLRNTCRNQLVDRLAHSVSTASVVIRDFSTDHLPWQHLEEAKLPSLPSNEDDVYAVSGVNRGIGHEFALQLLSRTSPTTKVIGFVRDPNNLASAAGLLESYPDRFVPVRMDLTDQTSIDRATEQVSNEFDKIDMLFNVSGILGDNSAEAPGPERRLLDIDRDWLTKTMDINLIGHIMLTKGLLPLLTSQAQKVRRAKEKNAKTKTRDGRGMSLNQGAPSSTASRIVNLSARVGSIGDNNLGGWFSYRISKAALNQFTKTSSLEVKRHNCIVVSMHPGTTDTDLSVPFQKNIARHKLFPVWYSCKSMLDVVWGLSKQDTGKFYAFDGQEIPW